MLTHTFGGKTVLCSNNIGQRSRMHGDFPLRMGIRRTEVKVVYNFRYSGQSRTH